MSATISGQPPHRIVGCRCREGTGQRYPFTSVCSMACGALRSLAERQPDFSDKGVELLALGSYLRGSLGCE